MRKKNILLVGEWASSNLGDQILCGCVENILKNSLPNITIKRFDISYGLGLDLKKKIKWLPYRILYKILNNNEKRNISYGHLKANWIKQDLKSIKSKIDLMVFCGGQMFMDYFAFQIESVVKYSRNRKIPIFWNACGAGKCNDTSIKIFRNCLAHTTQGYLTVRDNESFFADVLYANPILVPDPALNSSRLISDKEKRQTALIGIGIMDPISFKQYHIGRNSLTKFLIDLIKDLNKKGYKVELFTNGSPVDDSYLHEIFNQININGLSVAPRPKNGLDLIKIISSYEKIISFRLHSHIISYACRIPSYGIIWDNKVKDFFIMTGNENNMCSLDKLSINNLINFVNIGSTSFLSLEKLKQESIRSLLYTCEKILNSEKLFIE